MRSVVLLSCFLATSLAAQATPSPSDTALAGITERGRQLAAYDQAAWHGTDAILAKWPNPTGVEGFLAQRGSDGGWRLMFGRLNAAGDTLLVGATAVQRGKTDEYDVTLHRPFRVGDDVERRAFLALRTAGKDLAASPPPFRGNYNSYALPRADGSWYIYFLPGQTQAGALPHGGDFRYDVTADGTTIRSKWAMHRGVLNAAVPDSGVAGMHTVLVADLPQDSDVFLVLSRRPSKPELIGTAHFDFEIRVDGTITWRVGKR